jgi:hypothetical protein
MLSSNQLVPYKAILANKAPYIAVIFTQLDEIELHAATVGRGLACNPLSVQQ